MYEPHCPCVPQGTGQLRRRTPSPSQCLILKRHRRGPATPEADFLGSSPISWTWGLRALRKPNVRTCLASREPETKVAYLSSSPTVPAATLHWTLGANLSLHPPHPTLQGSF